jgi:hypothetical protein
MNERKIELTWVCTSCQHRNRGRDKVCAGCGDAKDASETFVMPGDTRSAASVTDPALLAAAKAGADWRCAFCRGDNRALDAACRRCGAQRGTTPANTEHLRKAPVAAQRAARGMGPGLVTGSLLLSGAMVVGVGVLGVLAVLGALLISANRRPRTRPLEPGSSTVQATVVSRAWETTLRESRFCLAPGEGFAEQQPADAIEVTPSGMRHHHDDRIEDGTETQTYFEDVPYQDTETYTEMVPCGEDCVSLPETCSEHCTDDGNGFASCSTTCSGGGQSCTPRTCAETRTRWVTRTRQEQRTRTVPHFRVEPRDAPWFRWRAHTWQSTRSATLSGGLDAPRRPTETDLTGDAALDDCQQTRLDQGGTWSVTVRTETGHEVAFGPPTLESFQTYEVGQTLSVSLDPRGRLEHLVE